MAGARQGPGRRLDERGRVSGSAQHLRRVLRVYLKAWELLFLADAAELAPTELIANVVRHVPLAITGDPLDDGGRGLVLVNAVTDDWGIVKRWEGGGKTFWFECPTPPESGDSRIRTARPEPRP
ncbi:ATP-binding protein [Streptomyces parvus]|uniref:ATP-binding protein n=1 Tax=Streptomyces parvus TaxID=66428 RepID=UPI00362F9010